MDPDANLIEQRRLRERILAACDAQRPVHPADIARLAELSQALDEWICNGGFLPAAWQKAQKAVSVP